LSLKNSLNCCHQGSSKRRGREEKEGMPRRRKEKEKGGEEKRKGRERRTSTALNFFEILTVRYKK